jgi:hypothetical protein
VPVVYYMVKRREASRGQRPAGVGVGV